MEEQKQEAIVDEFSSLERIYEPVLNHTFQNNNKTSRNKSGFTNQTKSISRSVKYEKAGVPAEMQT